MADRYVRGKRIGLALGAIAVVGAVVVMFLLWAYPQTTVIVLRHAEKDTTPTQSDDSVQLTPDGTARAQTLANVLEQSGVSKIYVTQKLRTQQTAEPLATRRGITPTQYTYDDNDGFEDGDDEGNDVYIAALVEEVLSISSRSRVVVIVGHNDTVPTIVERFGGGTVTVGNEFDNLFVLTVSPLTRRAHLIKATYGAPR